MFGFFFYFLFFCVCVINLCSGGCHGPVLTCCCLHRCGERLCRQNVFLREVTAAFLMVSFSPFFVCFEYHSAGDLTAQAPCQPMTVQSKFRVPGSVPGELNVISKYLQTQMFSL